MTIKYIKGDATSPVGEGEKIIVHICNDLGKWGRGFVLAISNRWSEPEQQYRQAFSGSNKLELGEVQFVKVSETITIANLIGQHGIKRKNSTGTPPVRYHAIEEGLKKIAQYCLEHNASVHMPRIGCGLAGGTWDKIEPVIAETLSRQNISTTVYDY